MECPPPPSPLRGRPARPPGVPGCAALSAVYVGPIRLGDRLSATPSRRHLAGRCAPGMERRSGKQHRGRSSGGSRERRLLAQRPGRGDTRAMDELFRLMLPLAERLARKYRWSREPLEDLLQVASLTCIERSSASIPSAEPSSRPTRSRRSAGSLKRYRRDFASTVHVSRSLQERAAVVRRELNLLSPAAWPLADAGRTRRTVRASGRGRARGDARGRRRCTGVAR